MDKFKRCNTDEITCPHCDYEFGDSWEETCPECGKIFDVSFDGLNVDDGFTTHVKKCEDGMHEYAVSDSCYQRNSTNDYYISDYARIERCLICDDYKFIPVKHNGSDFTKEELLAFKMKKRLEKKDKKHLPFSGIKTGEFTIEYNSDLILKLKEPEGNLKIWVELCRLFKSKGFTPQKLPDYLRRNKVSFKKDWLECDIELNNFAISVKFFQNEVLKYRKKGDGRYEHDNYKLVDPSMKLKFRAYTNFVKKYFISKGFEFKQNKRGVNSILDKLEVSDLFEWKDPRANHNDNKDSNGKLMKSGDLKYFYDGKVLERGFIYWNNGNQWYVLCNGEVKQTSHFYLFDYNGEPKRKPLTKDEQIQRLHSELKKAEKQHEYDKCKALWKLIQSYKLYHVYSIKHEAWWCGNNSGYTKDKNHAGVYTYENIMANQSYYNDGVDSKAVEID